MKTAFAFLLCISVGYCHDHISCYECMSKKSWDDCASKKEEIDCSADQDTCTKLYFDGKLEGVSLKSYAKGCSSKSACNKDLCKTFAPSGTTVNSCEVYCCEGDLCNAAKVPMVSVFLLLTCAFIAFVR